MKITTAGGVKAPEGGLRRKVMRSRCFLAVWAIKLLASSASAEFARGCGSSSKHGERLGPCFLAQLQEFRTGPGRAGSYDFLVPADGRSSAPESVTIGTRQHIFEREVEDREHAALGRSLFAGAGPAGQKCVWPSLRCTRRFGGPSRRSGRCMFVLAQARLTASNGWNVSDGGGCRGENVAHD